MTTNDVFLDACKGLVMHCNCNILILNVLGDFRAYIAPEVRLKLGMSLQRSPGCARHYKTNLEPWTQFCSRNE